MDDFMTMDASEEMIERGDSWIKLLANLPGEPILDAIVQTKQPLGRFLQFNGRNWIACDNSKGEAIIEEFKHIETAVRWIHGEFKE